MRSHFMTRLDPRFQRAQGDEGVAMIMVIGTMVVMSVLVGVALTIATNYAPMARKDQDWNGALAAAQAGVDDYIARLNQSDLYWAAVDCTNEALQGPKTGPNSCGWTASTPAGWQQVRGGVAGSGQFHYDVDPSKYNLEGFVNLTSTGKVNGVTRTIQVRVSKGGPTKYLYYTDYEDADPANKVPYPSGAKKECGGSSDPSDWKYFWQGRSGCSEITFIGGDVLDGLAHFNDSPLMTARSGQRPKFLQGYEVADPACKDNGRPDGSGNGRSVGKGKCWRSTSDTTPYVGAFGAVQGKLLYLEDSSAKFVNYPGCFYTGDTRIRFKSDGTMDVWTTKPPALGPDTPAGTSCGAKSSTDAQGRPTTKSTVPVPDGMVIYAKNSGTTKACVPGQVVNGTSSDSTNNDVIPTGSGDTTTGVTDISYFDPDSVSSTMSRSYSRNKNNQSWTSGTLSGPTESSSGDDHPSTYDCGSGNIYIEGTVKGRVTIAAQNNIIVTNDMLLASTAAGSAASGTDMVGLVASNSVVVYHPVSRGSSTSTSSNNSKCPSDWSSTPSTSSSNGTSLSCTWTTKTTFNGNYYNIAFPGQTNGSGTRWMYVSMQTLAHSFTVQRYDKGTNLGELSVRGSIAQKWRGAVGTGSNTTGYLKDYKYDQRLKFAAPPYFPAWTNAVWAAATTGELQPQYG